MNMNATEIEFGKAYFSFLGECQAFKFMEAVAYRERIEEDDRNIFYYGQGYEPTEFSYAINPMEMPMWGSESVYDVELCNGRISVYPTEIAGLFVVVEQHFTDAATGADWYLAKNFEFNPAVPVDTLAEEFLKAVIN